MLFLVEFCGISGRALGIISSFLCERQVHVVLGGKFSQEWRTNSGLPHDSIFGFTVFYI